MPLWWQPQWHVWPRSAAAADDDDYDNGDDDDANEVNNESLIFNQ